MTLNVICLTTYHYVDSDYMMVVQDDDMSWRDSVGRNVLCLFAYGRNHILEAGLENCLGEKNGQLILHRHPRLRDDMSKDHWSYFIMYRYWLSTYTKDLKAFDDFIDRVPRITGLYNWMYALTGSKYDELGYYLVQIPGAWLGSRYNNVIRFIGNIRDKGEHNEVSWDKTGKAIQQSLTPWQKTWRKLLLPAYSLHNKAWQVTFMRPSVWRNILRKLLLRRLPDRSTNYLVRLLLRDDTVTQREIDNYQHMTNYRWGVNLDQTTSRHLTIIKDPKLLEYNAYEKDLLITLYDG
jgi:hypothetical protein